MKGIKKMKKFFESIFIFIAMLFISISAFGGGALYWIAFCIITGISGEIAKMGCVISLCVFSILGFWLAPKFSDKYL
jgi:hypothetical protein